MPAPFGVRSGNHPGDDLGTWDGSGNITIPGVLTASGGIVNPSNETVTGNQTVTGNLTVGGNSSLTGSVQVVTGPLFTADVQVFGILDLKTAGQQLRIKEGANAIMGTAVLVAGTVVVATTAVTATSRIFLTSQVDGGTPGFIRVSARTAGTSFTITGIGTDTSTVAWLIINPGP